MEKVVSAQKNGTWLLSSQIVNSSFSLDTVNRSLNVSHSPIHLLSTCASVLIVTDRRYSMYGYLCRCVFSQLVSPGGKSWACSSTQESTPIRAMCGESANSSGAFSRDRTLCLIDRFHRSPCYAATRQTIEVCLLVKPRPNRIFSPVVNLSHFLLSPNTRHVMSFTCPPNRTQPQQPQR